MDSVSLIDTHPVRFVIDMIKDYEAFREDPKPDQCADKITRIYSMPVNGNMLTAEEIELLS